MIFSRRFLGSPPTRRLLRTPSAVRPKLCNLGRYIRKHVEEIQKNQNQDHATTPPTNQPHPTKPPPTDRGLELGNLQPAKPRTHRRTTTDSAAISAEHKIVISQYDCWHAAGRGSATGMAATVGVAAASAYAAAWDCFRGSRNQYAHERRAGACDCSNDAA